MSSTDADFEADFRTYAEKAGLDMETLDAQLMAPVSQNGIYYLHGDHLGTGTFVTDGNALATQFFLNLPFGETFAEQQILGRYQNQYKFNAKELDSETGLYYYGARYYNPRLSIWYGVDPLSEKYPSISPYTYCMDNPINAVDPNGKEIIFIQIKKDGSQVHLQYKRGNFYYLNGERKGEKYDGRTHQVSKNLFRIARAYRKIEHSKNAILKDRLHTLEKSKNKHYLFEPTNEDDPSGMQGSPGVGSKTRYNLTSAAENARFKEIEGIPSTDLATIAHEMQHQYDKEINNQGDATNINDADNPSEQRAVKTENEARKLEGSPLRTTYGGKKVPTNPKNYTIPNEKVRK